VKLRAARSKESRPAPRTSKKASAHGAGAADSPLLALQRAAGNGPVSSLLATMRRDGRTGELPPVAVMRQVATAPAQAPAPVAAPAPAEPDTAWIAELPGEIQEQIDMFSEKYLSRQTEARQQVLLGQRAANRITFMRTMSRFLGSFDAVEAHYKEIKPMPGTNLWAHVSTRERLMAVQEDLKAQGSPMPETDVALGLRGDHLHPEGKQGGWYTHAAGFAIDWKAYAAPHVTDERLSALFETVTGGKTYFDLGLSPQARISLLEKMGQGTADEKESSAFLARVESEYIRLRDGSKKFKTDLPESSLAPLREVEAARTSVIQLTQHLAYLRQHGHKKAEVEEAAQQLVAAKAAFDEKLKAVRPHLNEIFEPWTEKLQARIDQINKAAAAQGVDLEKLSGRFKFNELHTALATIRRKEAPLQHSARAVLSEVLRMQRILTMARARADAGMRWLAAPGPRAPAAADAARWSDALAQVELQATAVGLALVPTMSILSRLLPGAALEPKPVEPLRPMPLSDSVVRSIGAGLDAIPDRIARSWSAVEKADEPLTALMGEEAARQKELDERTAYRQATVTALGGGTSKAQQQKGEAAVDALLRDKVKLLALQGAKDALMTDAEGFVFKARDVNNPAITQLLGLQSGTQGGGFFTPNEETGGEEEAKKGKMSGEHGFNLKFFKSMVKHGFELGVAWTGSADTMHFELAEGRQLLMTGGQEALVAGKTLAAEEASQPPASP
jgi:hypothetical protein